MGTAGRHDAPAAMSPTSIFAPVSTPADSIFELPKLGGASGPVRRGPVSRRAPPPPAFLPLLSADPDHSFWVPRLAGTTDLIPHRPNSMWIDPRETGLYRGRCAQYCGTQHATMRL